MTHFAAMTLSKSKSPPKSKPSPKSSRSDATPLASLPAHFLDTILSGDCIAELQKLPARSVDMVFADPPYNLQLRHALHRPDNSQVAAVDADWDKFSDFAAYDDFSTRWLQQARRVLKPHGTIWVIGSYHNIFRLGTIMQNLGFWILNDIIWRKSNPMPNFRGTRFTNAHETLIWAARDDKAKGYIFNYQAMKSLNDDTQMRSDWVLPICAGHERLKNAKGQKLHPTQKPERLLQRILLAASRPDDIILDPFFGTGTTGAVAKKLGRHFIGIEADADYIAAATRRIAKIRRLDDESLQITPAPAQQKRIPFGMLVENGTLRPGTRLFGPARKYQARVRADGSLKTTMKAEGEAAMTGSIHRVGAAVQGIQACNGWTFWHVLENDRLVPIDDLRRQLRENLPPDEQ